MDDRSVVTETSKIVGTNSYRIASNRGTEAIAVLDGLVITAGGTGRMSFGGGMHNFTKSRMKREEQR